MIAVIIAGGAGTRLWPLSTPEYPKHLLKVSDDDRSLMQNAYQRARRLSDHIYVVTAEDHAHHVRQQLADLPEDAFIIEPARRGTSGCMLAAMHHVQSRHDHDEPVAVLWADHCIRDVGGFVQSFRLAGEASRKHNRAVLVGIEPTYPSTGFGYIHKAEPLDNELMVYNVAEFKEKPPLELANDFFQSGEYLWNGGYVVSTVRAFQDAIGTYCPQLQRDYATLLAAKTPQDYTQAYLALDNIALDYTFNELVKNLLVVPATFDWMDLGSFKDMYDFMEHDDQGNHTRGRAAVEEVENTLILNEEHKPVAVIGLDNIVVINTANGLLVARKDLAQKVKEVVARLDEDDAY